MQPNVKISLAQRIEDLCQVTTSFVPLGFSSIVREFVIDSSDAVHSGQALSA